MCHACIHACASAYACLLLPVAACIFFFAARVSSRAVSVLSQAIFKPCSLQHALSLSSAPLLAMSSRRREPRTRRLLFVFPALCPRFVESNLFLTEMSATIKASPVGGVMLLKGFACLLEVGLGEHTGMSYVPW